MERLREAFGVRLQIDCRAIIGKRSLRMRRFVKQLLKWQLVDYEASDAHDRYRRPIMMDEVYCILKK